MPGDTDKQGTWVNTFCDSEETTMLDELVAENGSDRAKMVRLLIRQEHERRVQVKATIIKLQKKGVWPH